MRLSWLVLVGLTLVPLAASAQQPAAPPPAPPPPAREGTAELSFVSTTGNTDTRSFGLGGDVIFRPDPWLFRSKVAFVRNETDGEVTAQSFAFAFRADRKISPRMSAFGEYDYLRNTFSGINHRNTLSGGVSYLLVDRVPHTLKVDGGLGYTNEQRVEGPAVNTALLLAGLGYKLKISQTAEFTDDMRYELLFDDAGNWRWGNIAALTAKLNQLFSLKLSNTVRHSNQPVAGFEKTDTITAIALVAKF